jgi:hypothetical protein
MCQKGQEKFVYKKKGGKLLAHKKKDGPGLTGPSWKLVCP